MKKSTIFLAMAMAVAFAAMANPVDREQARKVGNAYLNAVGHGVIEGLEEVKTPFSEFYVFNAVEAGSGSRSGFVLVAADDCVRPILGYSLTNTFREGDIPANVKSWLEDIENGIKKERVENGKRKVENEGRSTLWSDEVVAQEWQRLASGTAPEPALLTSVSPLLTTTWNQSPLYNDLCPYDSSYGQHVVTGCVATATAQIMKYWNHPATGYGSHSYHAGNSHADYGWLTADFGATNYAWSTMPNALTSASSAAEINAVATLIYHVGVAVEMGYNVSAEGGSSAFNHSSLYPSAMSALIDYFKYSPDIMVMTPDVYDNAAYCAALRAELDQSRPILYEGRSTSGGHSFVCDGYDMYNNFHFNWGWGGAYDGYYALGALNPTSSHTYNISNTAMLGIRPNADFGTGGTVTVNTTGGGSTCTATGGGTYAFGNTVTLVATAGEGYRFAGWSDNSQETPRIFTMTGGNYTFTARFETLGGDTLSYCSNKGMCNVWGEFEEGLDKYWGIKLPASSLTPGNTLKAVEIFIGTNYNGTFDLTVYSGTTGPTDTVYSTSEWVGYEDRNDWFSFFLPTPYTIEAGKNIWITFHNSDIMFPASICTSSGNPDGFLYGPAFNPDPEWTYYTYMIRARFDNARIVAQGDTLSYCGNKPCVNSWTPEEWGIMIPSADLAGRNYLKSVKLYTFATTSDAYTLRVYKGGSSAPGTLVHTQPVVINTYGWQEVAIDSTIAIGSNDSLWITFSCPTAQWAAVMCHYTGNPNSNWLTWGGTWEHASYDWGSYSWMIKAVTSATAPTLPPPSVAIRGSRDVSVGTGSILIALHTTHATVTWDIPGAVPSATTGDTVSVYWPTTGWFQATATAHNSHGDSSAYLWVNVVDCDEAITNYPYHLGFESTENMVCITQVNADNDGNVWDKIGDPYIGQFAFVSNGKTWNGEEWVTATDNWFILPKMATHQSAGYSMEWYDMTFSEENNNPHYGVFIDTTCSSNPANYMLVAEYTIDYADTWYQPRSLDLSAYAGKTFRLAFRHYNAGANNIYIDEITVKENIPFFREGDTISYCGWHDVHGNLGYSGTTHWGVKFPSARLAGCDTLKSVLLYVAYDGSYTLNITQEGTDAPGTFIRSVDTVFNGQYGWQEFVLDPALPFDNMQPLWVTFLSTAYNPAMFAQFSGDYNSDWISGDGENWVHATDYGFDASWMIKAVTAASAGVAECANIPLPYDADFTQCWTAIGGATFIDAGHASLTSQGQRIVSPWLESTPGEYILTWRTTTDDNIWDDSGIYTVTVENESGAILYNAEYRSYNTWWMPRFISYGGRIRVLFERTGEASIPSFRLTEMAVFSYPMSLTIDAPGTAYVGDTVTIQAIASLPNGDTATFLSWNFYKNGSWVDETEIHNDSSITFINSTDTSHTVVFHGTGSYGFSAYIYIDGAFGTHIVDASYMHTITVFDTATVDCNNITLPYTADFTQCWTAENGATIIDPNYVSLADPGQRIVGPWIETVPGTIFCSFNSTGEWNENAAFFVGFEDENGNWIDGWNYVIRDMRLTPGFNNPGGRIRMVIENIGTVTIPSFQISDLAIYQYDINVSLDAPHIASVGDTVTISILPSLQNGDTPDGLSLWMYDLPNYIHCSNLIPFNTDNTTVTLIDQTDNSITLVWNAAGRYEMGCSIAKYGIYGSSYAYANCIQTIQILNHSFYLEDSIYYTSVAKDTVIGCHPELHIANLPESVSVICDSAFFNLANLSSISLPDNLIHIGKMAFALNYGLTEVTIPRGVQFMGDNAFWGCNSLEVLNFNADNCQTMSPTTASNGSYWPVFIGCGNLHTINIGENVTQIPDRAFWGSQIRGRLVIPNSVVSIGYDAFYHYNATQQGSGDTLCIVLGSALQSIGDNCFPSVPHKLHTVISLNPVPPSRYDASFYVDRNFGHLIVPCGSAADYSAAPFWSEFIISEDCTGIEDIAPDDDLAIIAVEGGIIVKGARNMPVEVYDVMGRKVAAGSSIATLIPIDQTGVYMVRIGDNPARKVVVIK